MKTLYLHFLKIHRGLKHDHCEDAKNLGMIFFSCFSRQGGLAGAVHSEDGDLADYRGEFDAGAAGMRDCTGTSMWRPPRGDSGLGSWWRCI